MIENKKKLPHNTRSLIFLVGVFSQLGQILTFREVISVCYGSELLYGVLIGGNLMWFFGGYTLGTRKLFFNFNAQKFNRQLVILALLNALFIILQLVSIRLCAVLLQINAEFSLNEMLLMGVFSSMPSAASIGLIVALFISNIEIAEFGKFYRMETWGAVFGGIIVSLFIVDKVPAIQMAIIIGVILVFVILLKRKVLNLLRRHQFILTLGLVFLCLLLMASLDSRLDQYIWQQKFKDFKLSFVENTKYGKFTVLSSPSTQQFNFYLNGKLYSSKELTRKDHSEKEFVNYLLTQSHSYPKNILIIGGSHSSIPDYLAINPEAMVTILELDEAVANFNISEDEYPRFGNTKKIFADPRIYISNYQQEVYDLIIIKSSEPSAIVSNRLCTSDFFGEIKNVLSEKGVFALLLPDDGASREYVSRELALRTQSIYLSLKQHFSHTQLLPINGHLLIANNSEYQLTNDPVIMGKRFLKLGLPLPIIQTENFGEVYEQLIPETQLSLYYSSLFYNLFERTDDLFSDTPAQNQVLEFEKSISAYDPKLNTDEHPTAVIYSIAYLQQYLKSIHGDDKSNYLGQFLSWLVAVEKKSIDLLIMFILISSITLLLIYRNSIQNKEQSNNRPVSLCCFIAMLTGFLGMFGEMLLLNIYQSKFGVLYKDIGLLISMFMFGLILGALFSDHLLKMKILNRKPFFQIVTLCLILTSMVLFCVVLLEIRLEHQIFIFMLMCIAGMLDGATFPILINLSKPYQSKMPSKIYGYDILGSLFGAIFVGTFLLAGLGKIISIKIVLMIIVLTLIGTVLLSKILFPQRRTSE